MGHILITGANGFIGSHMVRRLAGAGAEVVCLVRSTSDVSSLTGLDVKLVLGDVRDAASLRRPVEGASYIYHLAASLMVGSRAEFFAANAKGTANLLAVAAEHAKSTLKRFVLVSSQAAAGPASGLDPVTEDRPPAPVSWYGESKRAAEEAARGYALQLPITIVRPSAVYGERERDISRTFAAVMGRVQPVLGFGKRYTNMIYVGDLVEGILAAAMHPNAVGKTYFLTYAEAYTGRDVVRTVAQAAGKPLGIPLPVPILFLRGAGVVAEVASLFTRARPALTRDKVRELSCRYWLCSPARAAADFAWSARTPLLPGMRQTVRYHSGEQRRVREMAAEPSRDLWIKYLITSTSLGLLIETILWLSKAYSFHPWWLVLVAVAGFWGLLLGAVARAVRTRAFWVQYLPGFAALSIGELANSFWGHAWEFKGVLASAFSSPLTRALALGLATGFFVPAVNVIMERLYRRKLRLG